MAMCNSLKTTATPPSVADDDPPDYSLNDENTGVGTSTKKPAPTPDSMVGGWISSSCNQNAKYRYTSDGHVEVFGRGIPKATDVKQWANVDQWRQLIGQVADTAGVSRALLAAVVFIESGGNANARGGAGELGLMQLLPNVAKQVANPRFPLDETPVPVDEYTMLQPAWNLMHGAKWLAYLSNRYQGNLISTLSTYNHGRVECDVDKNCGANHWGVWTNCGYIDGVIEYLNFAVDMGYSGPRVIDLGEGGAEETGASAASLIIGVMAGAAAYMGYRMLKGKGK
jgi:hypothetical protein